MTTALACNDKPYSIICLPVCSCVASTCFLVILHLTIRITTTVHTNTSSTSVDGVTVMMMMMVDIGKLGCCCAGVAVTDVVAARWMDERLVVGSGDTVWKSKMCVYYNTRCGT